MNFSDYTESIKAHLLIKESKLDVKIVSIAYKNYPTEKFTNGKKVLVVGINIANNDKAKEDSKGILQAIFNDQSIEAARLRPQGCNFTCIDYQGDRNRKKHQYYNKEDGRNFVQES